MDSQQENTFTIKRMDLLPGAGSLKAFVDVTIDNQVEIRSIHVLEGQNGHFISLPSEWKRIEQDRDILKTAQSLERLTVAILKHYYDKTQKN